MKVQHTIGAIVRNRAWLQPRRDDPYLNVGCGPNIHPRCTNLDYDWRPHVLCWDVTKPLPFRDGWFLGIFTEHCIEHIPLEKMQDVLAEFRRVMKRGGTLRVVVPDAAIYLENYARGVALPYAECDTKYGFYSPIMSVNRVFIEEDHRFMYDFDALSQLLNRAGFGDIRRESYRKGRDVGVIIDCEERAIESLYVEATKM